jgi:hypothetical protein
MRLADVSHLASQLDSVTERMRGGMLDWRVHGRLVARQLDDNHIVVADLENGNADAIEDALIGAWELQSGR